MKVEIDIKNLRLLCELAAQSDLFEYWKYRENLAAVSGAMGWEDLVTGIRERQQQQAIAEHAEPQK